MLRRQRIQCVVLTVVLAFCNGDNDDSECQVERKHIHLALGPDPSTSMTISFASISSCCENITDNCAFAPFGSVLIGTSPAHLNYLVTESIPSKQYSAQYNNGSWYNSPYFHHILVEGLEPSTKYYYHCISTINESRGEIQNARRVQQRRRRIATNEIYSFVTAPNPGNLLEKNPITIAFIADTGRTDAARANFAHLDSHKSDIQVLMVAGDLAYSHFMHHRWDDFFDMLEGIEMTKQIPIMVAAGNHDIDRHVGTGEMFVAYENRFQMPQIQPAISSVDTKMEDRFWEFDIFYPLDYDYGNGYYAFTLGPSRNIVICSYSGIHPGSRQHHWLTKELGSIDRTRTPWITVTMHVPIYNTFSNQTDPQMEAFKEHLEPLLVNHQVNLVFSGHVHGYQQMHPTIYNKVNKKGPVHMIGGNGGIQLVPPTEESNEYVAKREWTCHGYATLTLLNQTMACWKKICVTSYDNEVPALSEELTYIVNQYYL